MGHISPGQGTKCTIFAFVPGPSPPLPPLTKRPTSPSATPGAPVLRRAGACPLPQGTTAGYRTKFHASVFVGQGLVPCHRWTSEPCPRRRAGPMRGTGGAEPPRDLSCGGQPWWGTWVRVAHSVSSSTAAFTTGPRRGPAPGRDRRGWGGPSGPWRGITFRQGTSPCPTEGERVGTSPCPTEGERVGTSPCATKSRCRRRGGARDGITRQPVPGFPSSAPRRFHSEQRGTRYRGASTLGQPGTSAAQDAGVSWRHARETKA